jgi:hypothetical protein
MQNSQRSRFGLVCRSRRNFLAEVITMPVAEIPIERFEVFATGLDHPECVAFEGWQQWTSYGTLSITGPILPEPQ